MWLAVDARAGSGAGAVRAWPVDDDGTAGAPVEAASLDQLATRVEHFAVAIVDGAGTAFVDCPADIGALQSKVSESALAGRACRYLPRLRSGNDAVAKVATLAGSVALLVKERPGARAHLICLVDEAVTWVHGEAGTLSRIALCTAPGSPDSADDDVAFERGLSLFEEDDRAAQRVLAEPRAQDVRNAISAGISIGRDVARGLRLGRLGGPVALVGQGLTAGRYAIALGRFGVAVRRLDPLPTFLAGCRLLASEKFICASNSMR